MLQGACGHLHCPELGCRLGKVRRTSAGPWPGVPGVLRPAGVGVGLQGLSLLEEAHTPLLPPCQLGWAEVLALAGAVPVVFPLGRLRSDGNEGPSSAAPSPCDLSLASQHLKISKTI